MSLIVFYYLQALHALEVAFLQSLIPSWHAANAMCQGMGGQHAIAASWANVSNFVWQCVA